jgi:signal transduction histidine kinase
VAESRGTLLVVDDSLVVRALTQRTLERHGFAVTAVGGGQDAVARARDGFDAVVCDLHLPDLDGYGVLGRLRDLAPMLPVIILSSDDQVASVLDAVQAGAFEYVLKGSQDEGRLVAAVVRAVAYGRLMRENEARRCALEEEVVARRQLEGLLVEARDRALSATRSKSSFLANMSHELRTPLNAILGYTDLLLDELGDVGRDDLTRIRGAGWHLLGLIDDILDLSMIEAGRVTVHPEMIEVIPLLEDIGATTLTLRQRNRNAYAIDVAPDAVRLVSDPMRVSQILLNLVANALKFTEDGEVTVRVRRIATEASHWLEIAVHDTGIGMDEQHAQRLFTEFMQADPSFTRRYGGTGLGLAISRRLCDLLGGTIEVTTSPGRGSEFRVRLPAELPLDPTPISREPTPVDATIEPWVLVIGRDEARRAAITDLLAAEHHASIGVATVAEGVVLARRHPPATIVVDVDEATAWDDIAGLRANSALALIPVMVSGWPTARNPAIGTVQFVERPVSRERLRQALRPRRR